MAKDITIGGQQGGADNTVTTYQDLGTYARLDRMEALLSKTIDAVDALTKQVSYSMDNMKNTITDALKNTISTMSATTAAQLSEISKSVTGISSSMLSQEQALTSKLSVALNTLNTLQNLNTVIANKDNKDMVESLNTVTSKIDAMMELQKQLIGATNQLASSTVTSISSVASVIAQSEDKAATSMILELKALKDMVSTLNSTMKEAYRLR